MVVHAALPVFACCRLAAACGLPRGLRPLLPLQCHQPSHCRPLVSPHRSLPFSLTPCPHTLMFHRERLMIEVASLVCTSCRASVLSGKFNYLLPNHVTLLKDGSFFQMKTKNYSSTFNCGEKRHIKVSKRSNSLLYTANAEYSRSFILRPP